MVGEENMVQLAREVQSEAEHRISFSKIALAIGQSNEDLAKVLAVSPATLDQMEKATQDVFTAKQQPGHPITAQDVNGAFLRVSVIR